MKKKICIVLGMIVFLSPLNISAISYVTNEEMITNLDVIKQAFDAGYAPADWKKTYYQWSLDREIKNAKKKVQSNPNTPLKDYQKILREVINSVRDYHVQISFWSTEAASLPFTVKGVNGKYFITAIDRAKMPQYLYSFEVGDELQSFGGKPTHQAIKELIAAGPNSTEETDQAFAERELTQRIGVLGMTVPKGSTIIRVRSKNSDVSKTYHLTWTYHPELIKSGSFYPEDSKKSNSKLRVLDEDYMNGFMRFPVADYYSSTWLEKAISEVKLDLSSPNDLGGRKSFFPDLGQIIWKSDDADPFHAYIFLNNEGRSIGYFRIPTYSVGLETGNHNIEELAKLMNYFEKSTDALVIDQVNNPGGNVFYMYALLATLSDKPLKLPAERFKITQEELVSAYQDLEEFNHIKSDQEAIDAFGNDLLWGYPVSCELVQNMKKHNEFIINEWNAGRRMTKTNYFFGLDTIKPHSSAQYTKPILMLVNGLSISCGDFAPAILQDNKRVTVFGSKTSGAGGAIQKQDYKNPFGIHFFTLTISIAERDNKKPIENLGVTPDIPYQLTEKDITGNYVDYIDAVNQAVNSILN